MANKQIKYNIGFKVDKSSLDTVRNSLQELSKMGLTQLQLIDKKPIDEAKSSLQNLKNTVQDVQTALTRSYDMKLDTVNVKTFNQEIEKSQGGLKNLAITMNSAGNTGKAAFTDLISTLFTAQNAIKETNKLFDSLKQSFLNTVKWSISSSILNTFTGSIQQAWGYTQRLDKSLNDIRIVTEKSNEEMEKFAKNANKAAKSLGSSTVNYTDAALIYYQQGLGEKDVQARTQTTVKAANVTGQSAAEVSEQLTAVWNGYKVVAEEAELYVDKLAAVAASTAADLEEISTGMSKVASAANAMGVDVDQLSAQLSTIVSVTRQDAAVVGTALKTIYSRMADLKVNGTDEFGVSLGEVSSSLKTVGIEVLDQEGNLREMGTVIEEVAGKWETWTSAQQSAVAQAIAGKRQYNNLLALFENWDMYESSLNISRGAEGTLQKQQDIYLDSIKAKLNELKTASEGLFDNLIDSESTKNLIDVLTWLVEAIDQLAQGLGGFGNILVTLGGILTKVYSSNITQGVAGLFTNHINKKFNKEQNGALYDLAKQGINIDSNVTTQGQKEAIQLAKQKLELGDKISQEQKEEFNFAIRQTLELEKQNLLLEEKKKLLNSNLEEMTAVDRKTAQNLPSGQDIANLTPEEKLSLNKDYIEKSRTATIGVESVRKRKGQTKAQRQSAVKLITQTPLTAENAELMKQKLKEYNTILTEVNKTGKWTNETQSACNQIFKEAQRILEKNTSDLEQQTRELEENTKETNANKKAQEDLNQERERLKKGGDLVKTTDQITSLVSNTLMAVSAFQQLRNIFSIFSDESLTGGEKTIQGITAILSVTSIGLVMVKNSIDMVKNATRGLQKTLGIISIILTVASLIAGLIMGIVDAVQNKNSETALNKAQKAAEEAAAAAEEAKNKVKSLREEYNTLLSDLQKYEDAKTTLDKMTEGTEEWRDAVFDVNTQVMDLINKYPELAKTLKSINGVYQIDTEALKSAQKKALYNATQINSIMNIKATAAQKKVANETAKQNISDYGDFGSKSVIVNGTSVDIDSSRLTEEGYMTDEREIALNNLIASGGELADKAQAAKDALEVNNAQIETQNALLKAHTQALVDSVANEHGYDAEIFSLLTNDINKDLGNYKVTANEIKADDIDTRERHNAEAERFKKRYSDNESLAALQRIFVEDTGKAVRSDGGREQVAKNIEAALRNALVGHTVSVDKSGFKEFKKVEDLGKVPVTVDGEEMTVSEALSLAESDNLEAALLADPSVKNLDTVINSEYNKNGKTVNQAAALFLDGGDASGWTGATLAEYSELSTYKNFGTDYINRVKAAKEEFTNNLKGLGFTTAQIAKMSHFTKDDAETLVTTQNQANAAGRGSQLKNVLDSITDPETYKAAADAAAKVNWDNQREVADFYFSYMGDIQDKLRKKELDYFKNINRELDRLNSELERSIGLERQSLLNDKIAQEKLGVTQAETNLADANYTVKQWKEVYGDIQYFNADGSVNIVALNNAIAKLKPNENKKDKDEYDRLMKLADAWDYVIDSEQSLQEHINNVIDAQIESFKYGYEFQKQMIEINRQWSELNTNLTTTIKDFDRSQALLGKSAAESSIANAESDFLTSISELSGIDTGDIFKTDSNGKIIIDDSQKFEMYKEALSGAMDNLNGYQEGINSLYESYLSIQDEILAKYNKEIEKREKIKSILQSSVDLMKMAGIGGTDTLFGFMTSYSQKEFEFAQAQLTAVQTEFEKITAEGATASQEMIDKVTENLAAAGENVLAKGQEYYSAIADQFANEMSSLFDKAVKIAGASNLAGVTEAWDLEVAKDSRYLDSVNEAYAISSLERQFNISIEATDNIAAQNKLLAKQAEIQQKLAQIKDEQGKLSQADLDRANAEYELTLKQIALEESQQAANKMKLTRDAMGNYTYQYVADQDAIAKAEEELAAAENNLYNMDKDRTQSLVSEYYSAMSEANSQIAEAMAANDQERVDRLKDYYFGEGGLLSGIQKELGFASSNLSTMENVYSTFTDSILTKDENGNTSFDLMKNSIIDMIYGTADEDGNRSGGYQSTMEVLSTTISGLFEEDGILQTLPEQMSKGLAAAIDVTSLTNASSSIVTNLPNILSKLQTFEAQIGGDQGFINKFNQFIKDNDAEEAEKKAKEEELRNNVKEIATKMQNKMKIWFENFSLGDFFFDQDSNESN